MAMTKGTDVMALRPIIRERGPDFERQYIDSLTPEARTLFAEVMAFSWSPVEVQMEVYTKAARLLFPGVAEPMFELGRMLARKTYSGIYKVFLRVPTTAYVLGRASSMWKTFFDAGEASVERVESKTAEFVVRGFPDYPHEMREMARGHMTVLLEMTRARNPQVRHIGNDPQAWRWRASWE
jgi:hypothetical protein